MSPALLLVAAVTVTATPLANPEILEPSIANEVEHALAAAPAERARSSFVRPGDRAAVASLTKGLTATDAAIRLVSAQRADGTWVIGTNDVTRAVILHLRELRGERVSADVASAGPRVIGNIPYSKASDQCVLKLRLPEGVTNFATVVWLHGGGLTGGKCCFGPWPKEAKGDPIATVGVGYRLMKEGSDAVRPGDCLDDAAAATAWALEHIADYGGDPKKVFLSGCSAGGYLTAMVGMDARWLAKYGHARGELSGLIPFTGQMTKHFNVRAIGFKDRDPQFAPKIDEWAPLFYAGATGIPPISFVCGGRDCEWKGRVEETELLAEALRDCGHGAVEFHETEGSHDGGVLESTYFLRDFVARRADVGIVGRFADGERVSFFGDSITHGGWYVGYLQLFQSLRRPGSNTRIMNCGISGDTASGGCRRFESDLLKQKPDRAFVMFGMNDVGRGLYKTFSPSAKTAAARQQALARYERNQREIVSKLLKSGVKGVLITPSPYDQYTVRTNRENLVACNDPGLADCAAIVRAIAREHNLGVVEFHRPLTALQEANPNVVFANDRVHPAQAGHLLMAAHVLDAMAYSPIVARAVIDAKAGSFVPVSVDDRGSRNCTATAIRVDTNGVAFTYVPKALPLPAIAAYREADRYYPLTDRLNRELLVVRHLPAGNYKVAFNGTVVGRATAVELEKGVNVALWNTPDQQLAMKSAEYVSELVGVWNKLRNYTLVAAMLERAGVDPLDPAAADKWTSAWLESQKSSAYVGAFRNWVKTFESVRVQLGELQAREENLREMLNAVRPVLSRVTILKN